MAIWAQSANAYRRYVPEMLRADDRALGLQQSHRRAAHPGWLRPCDAHRASRRRGPTQTLSWSSRPSWPASGTASPTPSIPANMPRATPKNSTAPALPTAWVNALEKFRTSDVVREAFGAPFQDVYFEPETDRTNWFRTHRHVARPCVVRPSCIRLSCHDFTRAL